MTFRFFLSVVVFMVLAAMHGCKREQTSARRPDQPQVVIQADDCLARSIAWGKPGRHNPLGRVPFTTQERAIFECVARANEAAIQKIVLGRMNEIEDDARYLKTHPPLHDWASVFGTGRLACVRSAWCQALWQFAGPELVKMEASR